MGRAPGARPIGTNKPKQETKQGVHARPFVFSRRPQKKEERDPGQKGPTSSRHCGIHRHDTRAPYHPQPTGGLCQGPCVLGGHCSGRGLPQGRRNSPKEAAAGPQANSSALPRPRPVGHQSTPGPPQTPTKHPRGLAHHPTCLWRPRAASGVPKRAQTGPCDFRLSAGCGPDLK